MPRVGGRELAERLALLRPGVRIIFMSGYAEESALPDVLAGATAFIQKPFRPEVLLAKLRELLAR